MAKILIAGIGGGKKEKGKGYNLVDYYIDNENNLYEDIIIFLWISGAMLMLVALS